MDEKIDKRVRKTKNLIRKTVIKLLIEEKEKITITKISEEADINRKTFYSYYNNVGQVLDEIEDEIVKSFDSIISSLEVDEVLRNPQKIFQSLTDLIRRDFDFYTEIMNISNSDEISFIQKIKEAIKQNLRSSLPDNMFSDIHTKETAINYSVSGMMEVYQSWLLNPKDVTIENLSLHLSVITFQGINGFIINKK